MTIRRVLILAPALLTLILLQSYFWVPTYEQQTKGNPKRLVNYITGSIGDASLLNPILSSDSASSSINEMVFEGLIDRDEELRFRGRLAVSWEIYEEAFFYINTSAEIPGLATADPKAVATLIRQAKRNTNTAPAELKKSLSHINMISVIPPQRFQVTRKEKDSDITISVNTPAGNQAGSESGRSGPF